MSVVSVRTLVRRINRKLAHEWARICVTRENSRWRHDLGAYHVVDRNNCIAGKLDNDVELETYARDLGCLARGERLD